MYIMIDEVENRLWFVIWSAGVVARLRGRMSEAERQVEGLFESLLSESFS